MVSVGKWVYSLLNVKLGQIYEFFAALPFWQQGKSHKNFTSNKSYLNKLSILSIFSPATQVLGFSRFHLSGKAFTELGYFRFTFLVLSEFAPGKFLPALPGGPLFLERKGNFMLWLSQRQPISTA